MHSLYIYILKRRRRRNRSKLFTLTPCLQRVMGSIPDGFTWRAVGWRLLHDLHALFQDRVDPLPLPRRADGWRGQQTVAAHAHFSHCEGQLSRSSAGHWQTQWLNYQARVSSPRSVVIKTISSLGTNWLNSQARFSHRQGQSLPRPAGHWQQTG